MSIKYHQAGTLHVTSFMITDAHLGDCRILRGHVRESSVAGSKSRIAKSLARFEDVAKILRQL